MTLTSQNTLSCLVILVDLSRHTLYQRRNCVFFSRRSNSEILLRLIRMPIINVYRTELCQLSANKLTIVESQRWLVLHLLFIKDMRCVKANRRDDYTFAVWSLVSLLVLQSQSLHNNFTEHCEVKWTYIYPSIKKQNMRMHNLISLPHFTVKSISLICSYRCKKNQF